MEKAMALEVVSGPMDGLKTLIRDDSPKTLLGRQVGNHLTLPLDMTISRWHAAVTKEGNDYYLTDENSLSGTWFNGSRIKKTKLFSGMVLMVGGTMVQVMEIPATQGNVTLEDTFFNDPLQVYEFSNFLLGILKKLRQQNNYFNLSNIFQLPEFCEPKNLDRYDGIRKLSSAEFEKEQSQWAGACDVTPQYRFPHKDQFLTPPRLWSIFDIASNNNTKKIHSLGLIEAILNEQHSYTARILNKDDLFVKSVAKKSFAPPQKTKELPPVHGEGDPIKKILTHAVIKLERILSGFIEDAVYSGFGKGEDADTSFLNLEDAAKQLNQSAIYKIVERTQFLEKNLIAVLAAHRDALTLFEKELGNRIYQAIEQEEHKGKFPGLLNPGASVSSAVKRVLKDAQLEGLSDHIVRNAIKDKAIF